MVAVGAVVWKLKSIGAITAIVGVKGIYAGRAPEGTPLPYICVDFPPGQTNPGQYLGGSGKHRKTPLVVYCYATSLEKAGEIQALVEPNLAPASGFVGTVTWNSISINSVTLGESYQHIDNPQEGDEVGKRSMAIPVTINHLIP